MRFTVVWLPDAIQELADIWIRASDQAAVDAASKVIEHRLTFVPDQVGCPYNGDRRLYVQPLEVIYSVSPDDCLVTVLQVFYIP